MNLSFRKKNSYNNTSFKRILHNKTLFLQSKKINTYACVKIYLHKMRTKCGQQ